MLIQRISGLTRPAFNCSSYVSRAVSSPNSNSDMYCSSGINSVPSFKGGHFDPLTKEWVQDLPPAPAADLSKAKTFDEAIRTFANSREVREIMEEGKKQGLKIEHYITALDAIFPNDFLEHDKNGARVWLFLIRNIGAENLDQEADAFYRRVAKPGIIDLSYEANCKKFKAVCNCFATILRAHKVK